MDPVFTFIALAARELALFAGVGLLLLGLSDLAVDVLWIGHRVKERAARTQTATVPPAHRTGFFAVFVPAWDEASVIADMLRAAVLRLGTAEFRIYVGCYPNDPDTIAAARGVRDPRIRIVVVDRPGPTTKAHCLNLLWLALGEDEEVDGTLARAIVLHDAEDVVHSQELAVFDELLDRYDVVQLPVQPLVDPNSRIVAGTYIDEFAESHGKELVVREMIGAALPLAGVGCAISRSAMTWVAALSDGLPFDEDCLTEDYELGLKLHALGGRGTFARVPAGSGLVVTREYFPATLDAAVRQKARWTVGIALSGWDRLGWRGGLAERWMRLRDRQSPLAAVLLLAAYVAFLLWLVTLAAEIFLGFSPPPVSALLGSLLAVNFILLCWRLMMRFGFVASAYGVAEGLRAVPRVVVSNLIAIMAAGQAAKRYRNIRRGNGATWGKTSHAFPTALPAE